MANRIRRFIEGSGPESSPCRGSRWISKVDLPDFNDEDEADDALSELLAIALEDTPPDMVKRMIAKLGQRRAVARRNQAVDEELRVRRPFPVVDVIPVHAARR
jgi:hypothetical protein